MSGQGQVHAEYNSEREEREPCKTSGDHVLEDIQACRQTPNGIEPGVDNFKNVVGDVRLALKGLLENRTAFAARMGGMCFEKLKLFQAREEQYRPQ